MKKYLLIILILFEISFNGCTETSDYTVKSIDTVLKGISPDQTGLDLEVFFIDSSFTKAILKSKRGSVYTNRLETKLDGGMRVDFFSLNSKGRVSYLTADSATIDDRTKNMIARGNVFVFADSSKSTLKTSVLQWNNITQKLYSSEFVVINTPDRSLQGWGFESDQNLTNYRIFRVSGVQK